MTDRDDLLRRTDLAALLDELSPRPPTKLGQNARWRCIDPGHDDQHPSISMFTDRRGIQRWRCWSGGHGGTAIDALLVGRGGTVAEAMAELERRAGVPSHRDREPVVRSVPLPRPAQDVPVSPELLEYVSACERLLWRPAGRPIVDYLVQERGLAPDVLEANHVGADPGPHVLRRAAGLPRGGPAAVLPTLDLRGNVTYVQARYLEPAEDRPKYDNPAGRLAANPRTGWCSPARQRGREYLLVCEGAIDALTAAGAGISAVAVLGATYVDERVAAHIVEGAAGRSIVIAFDGDHAGQAATESLSAALATAGYGSRDLSLPRGTDLNSVVRQECDWIGRQLDTHVEVPSLRHDLERSGR
jgi:DNA primase